MIDSRPQGSSLGLHPRPSAAVRHHPEPDELVYAFGGRERVRRVVMWTWREAMQGTVHSHLHITPAGQRTGQAGADRR